MKNDSQEFINFCTQHNALKFGDFTLKSGRKSAYFFNIGAFHDGEALKKIGQFYANAIQASGIEFDMLFGPAYKGIPLVAATAIAFASEFNKNIPYAFNRKEAKDHGEGGIIVGAPLKGRVLILDDVITAGTAIKEVLPMMTAANVTPAGLMVALDRQENGSGNAMASQEITEQINMPVISIISREDLKTALKHSS